MLRQPPSSITLSPVDIGWHLQRIKQQQLDIQNVPQKNSLRERLLLKSADDGQKEKDRDTINIPPELFWSDRDNTVIHEASTPANFFEVTQFTDTECSGAVVAEVVASSIGSSPIDANFTASAQLAESGTEDDYMPVVLRPSSPTSSESAGSCSSLSPRPLLYRRIHSFDFSGFSETKSGNSSPVSREIPKPRGALSVDIRRMLTRASLLAPPLFQMDAVSHSTGRRFTTSFTPRGISFGTIGLPFPQSPKRPKAYRPRTLSYSFVESERTSGDCGNPQPSDDDSNCSELNFRVCQKASEEIRTTSVRSSSPVAELSSSPPEIQDHQRPPSFASSAKRRHEPRHVSSCCLSLPVPPPLSETPSCLLQTLAAPFPDIQSQSRSHSNDPVEPSLVLFECIPDTPNSHDSGMKEDCIHPGVHKSSLRTLLDLTLPQPHIMEAGLVTLPVRTSIHSAPPSFSPPVQTTPRPAQVRYESAPQLDASPSHTCQKIQVYDDRVPASFQPQTPQNLPEDRHRSRFHPSYTAPVLRHGAVRSPRRGRQRRHRGSRSDSPSGLDTPGFRGLYGGLENTEDELLFDWAARRIWELQEARRNGTSTSNTPERERSLRNDRIRYY